MKSKKDPYREQRREVPPPPQVHRDRTKYTRKTKHKEREFDQNSRDCPGADELNRSFDEF